MGTPRLAPATPRKCRLEEVIHYVLSDDELEVVLVDGVASDFPDFAGADSAPEVLPLALFPLFPEEPFA
jgi:hypothetical protein